MYSLCIGTVHNIFSPKQEAVRGQASSTEGLQIRDLRNNHKLFILPCIRSFLFRSTETYRNGYQEQRQNQKSKCYNAIFIPLSAPLQRGSTSTAPSFFPILIFLSPSLVSVHPDNSTHSMFLHTAHVPCKWNYSTSHDKRCQDKEVDSVCCFVFNCQNSNRFPIRPLCALCMWVPKCIYIRHMCRGCDAWEAREAEKCSVLKLVHKL